MGAGGEKAGTTDIDAVRQAMYGQTVPNLTGGMAVMNGNHHLSKPVLIGEIQDDGQFDIGLGNGRTWSPATPGPTSCPESAKLTADWTEPWVLRQLHGAPSTKECAGQNYE